ncbi:MAG: hypothetical protein HZA31_05820 [Opitutae bacterium]|nr:hypothetical protein [Opitutae bacterium]
MKKPHLIGVLLVSAAVIAGAYLTNIGQEMAVRVGNLSGDDLHRFPSPALLAEARAATSATETKKVMSAFHMIMNAQLLLIGATGGVGAAFLIMQRKK